MASQDSKYYVLVDGTDTPHVYRNCIITLRSSINSDRDYDQIFNRLRIDNHLPPTMGLFHSLLGYDDIDEIPFPNKGVKVFNLEGTVDLDDLE